MWLRLVYLCVGVYPTTDLKTGNLKVPAKHAKLTVLESGYWSSTKPIPQSLFFNILLILWLNWWSGLWSKLDFICHSSHMCIQLRVRWVMVCCQIQNKQKIRNKFYSEVADHIILDHLWQRICPVFVIVYSQCVMETARTDMECTIIIPCDAENQIGQQLFYFCMTSKFDLIWIRDGSRGEEGRIWGGHWAMAPPRSPEVKILL